MVNAAQLGFKEGEATVYIGTDVKVNSRSYTTCYLEIAPQINAAHQRALNSAEILTYRLAELNAFAERYKRDKWTQEKFEKECPWNTLEFNTGTVALAAPRLIFIQHNSPQLAAVTPTTGYNDGSLALDGIVDMGKITAYSGEILEKLKKDNLLNNKLTEKQVVDGDKIHPIWRGYANGDNALVQRLTSLTFKVLRDIYEKKEGMGTYLNEEGDLRPVMLCDIAGGFHDGNASATVGGGWHGGDIVRVVGVAQGENAPEGCRAERAQLENASERGRAPLEERVGK